MIDYKQKYNELYKFLALITILMIISLMFFILGFRGMINNLNEKEERIWQLEVINEDLKEQIYMLSNSKESEEI